MSNPLNDMDLLIAYYLNALMLDEGKVRSYALIPAHPKLGTFLHYIHLKVVMMSNQPNKLTYGLHTI